MSDNVLTAIFRNFDEYPFCVRRLQSIFFAVKYKKNEG